MLFWIVEKNKKLIYITTWIDWKYVYDDNENITYKTVNR